MQCCHLPLTSLVISLGMCPTTVKLFFRWIATAYLSCSLSYLQNVSNCSPTRRLHMRSYTWWPHTLHFTTNWLLGVVVVLGPSAMFTFTERSWQALIAFFYRSLLIGIDGPIHIDRACYWSLLTGIDGPACFSSEATRSPNARTTLLTKTSHLYR